MRNLFSLILLLPLVIRGQFADITLVNWSFKEVGQQGWIPAKVPGTVHTDLFAAGKITNPFQDTSERSLQWIEERDWVYSCSFTCSPEFLSQDHIEITFAGLDTYAEVVLNSTPLLSANNAFRTYTVDVKPLLATNNTLTITFRSAVKEGRRLAKKLRYTLPGKESVFTRKPPYQYGWDWAPRFVTCGITGPVTLSGWSYFQLRQIQARTLMVRGDTAFMQFTAKVTADSTRSLQLFLSKEFPFKDYIKERYTVFKGENTLTCTFQLPQAKLWWCNGMGTPYLYNYYYQFNYQNKSTRLGNFRFGVRTIELVQHPDSSGSSFYFKLNNQPVFIKGANYVPSSSFLPNVRWKQLDSLLLTVKNSQMNMIRIWGGGTYGSDWLYEICDRYGILIWQDFPFACAMYPGDKLFLENVSAEAIENIERIKGHPSLALLCGNNECDEGWHNWGWQKEFKYSKKDSSTIYSHYKTLFHECLPGLVRKSCPEIPYIPSSPQYGWGRSQSYTQGDSHYWGVWWGLEPFEKYAEKVPRFASEFGFQGMPDVASFSQMSNVPLSLNHPVIRCHQKHPRGFETIQTYLLRSYQPTENFAAYVYLSQLVQRDGMRIAITAHRTHRNYCMGTMFWQLNDCWPVTSWSAIDYFGRKKAFGYELKRLYSTVHVGIDAKQEGTTLTIVNDSATQINGTVNAYLMTFTGDTLSHQLFTATINKYDKQIIKLYNQRLPIKDSSSTYLLVTVMVKNRTLTKNRYFYMPPRALKLPNVKITITPKGTGVYEIRSDRFAKDVYLFTENQDIYSDNFFDLEPNTPYLVTIPSAEEKNIKVVCLNNLYQN